MTTLSDHFLTAAAPILQVNVSSATLDQLMRAFTCASFNWADEVIIDAAYIEDMDNKAALSEILGVPLDTEYPTDGYLVFYN